MDEIRCDEKNYLIWKWRPEGRKRKGENAIRLGSSLRVREGSVAIFVYSDTHGQVIDYLAGPRDEILTTRNLPGLASLVGLAYHGGTPFPAEVYFVNLAEIVQIRFGVPYFDVFDPRFPDFSVPIAVRGTITFRIQDYQEFIFKHRLDEFNLEDFKRQIRDALIRYVRSVVTRVPSDHGIPLVQIGNRIDDVNDMLLPLIRQRLETDFAVRVVGVDISDIELDKASEGYRLLMSVTRDQTSQVVYARTDAEVANIRDQQRINAENLEGTLRAQREEDQYARRKSTQTENLRTYELEVQGEVGKAGSEALKASGGGGSFGPGALMADLFVGGAVGKGMASMLDSVMKSDGATPTNAASGPAVTPPPVPSATFYMARDGVATGPFSTAELTQKISANELTAGTLVWQAGMAAWAKAGDEPTVSALIARHRPPQTPPPIPQG